MSKSSACFDGKHYVTINYNDGSLTIGELEVVEGKQKEIMYLPPNQVKSLKEFLSTIESEDE